MQFNSYWFVFLFLPVTLGGYLALRRTNYANAFMLVASLYFYAVGALWYLAPLFVTALLDFYIGQKIEESGDPVFRKRLLITSVVANLSLLSFFKYTTWITKSVLPGLGIDVPPLEIALPPAISFYTFQSMSYTIDIYRREFKPYRNVIDYMSFVSFFPHLVAGPIMRARDLLPQLAKHRPLPSMAVVTTAFFMILFGLFQKTVLADNFGGLVETISRTVQNGSMPAGMGLLFAYAFAFQIYCDFAAYSTIARGVARLFNVYLMRNFLTPYLATNPSDFWSRWHISLSTWLRDYLYIPLGGNRGSSIATMRNLMLTMLLGGLWHGANWTFLVWGAYHGALLMLYRAVPIDSYIEKVFGRRLGKILSIVLFFHLVCVGWIFFRASPAQIAPIFNSIAALPGAAGEVLVAYKPYFIDVLHGQANPVRVAIGILWGFVAKNWALSVYAWGIVLFALPVIATDLIGWWRNCEFPDLFELMPWPLRTAVILLLFYGIVFFARREANEFIYFAF